MRIEDWQEVTGTLTLRFKRTLYTLAPTSEARRGAGKQAAVHEFEDGEVWRGVGQQLGEEQMVTLAVATCSA